MNTEINVRCSECRSYLAGPISQIKSPARTASSDEFKADFHDFIEVGKIQFSTSNLLGFELIVRRFVLRSTLMTSNCPLEDWGKLIGDTPSASAILDCFMHHAEILKFTGRSYRLSDRQENSKWTKAPTAKPADETGNTTDLKGTLKNNLLNN